MADFSLEQQQALAKARARKRASTPDTGMRGFRADEPVRFGPGGFLDAVKSVGQGSLDFLGKGIGSIAGGIAAAPVAFDPKAPDIIRNVSESVSEPFSAETPIGQNVSEALSFPFFAAERGADALGELTPGGPGVQTAVKTGILGLPALLGKNSITRNPLSRQQQVLQESQAVGYRVPTSSANPASITRGAVEGVAGKPRMQQQASFKNQKVTNDLAAESLGLPKGTEITAGLLKSVRDKAGQAYDVLNNAGTITATTSFRRDLSSAVKDLKKASKDFEVLTKADSPVSNVIAMAQGLNKPTFQASSVVTATKVLRDEASAAFRNGQASVGRAYRDLSRAIEDAAQRHLDLFGDAAAVQAFRDARVQIAKSYSIEKALDGDGFVSAPKLAAQKKRGDPLSGELEQIALFAENFPKSARVIKETPMPIGRLGGFFGAGGGGAAIGGSPALGLPVAALAFGGPLIRAGLLSRLGQATVGRPKPSVAGLDLATLGLLGSGELSRSPEQR